MDVFTKDDLTQLWKPEKNSNGEDNGQITIIGGSKLFHGAPILSLKVASRFCDMVFFASPEKPLESIVNRLKSELSSFIWVPWSDVEAYIEKSDAILIGPGLMRYSKEQKNGETEEQKNTLDGEGKKTYEITKNFLTKFPDKKWVIDAGSLQVIEPQLIPENAVITPNMKEFQMLFGGSKEQVSDSKQEENQSTSYMLQATQTAAKKYKCTIVLKGPETIVSSPTETVVIKGGNAGLTKGGTGDILAGLIVSLLAKNGHLLAASAASFIEKRAADGLYKKVGTNYSADDLAAAIPETLENLLN